MNKARTLGAASRGASRMKTLSPRVVAVRFVAVVVFAAPIHLPIGEAQLAARQPA